MVVEKMSKKMKFRSQLKENGMINYEIGYWLSNLGKKGKKEKEKKGRKKECPG
ncbi:MAG: hypothetical protein AB1779_04830 [Candidatus Thermoplasmatota archaeon]